ncbi:DNA replication terminus site-binding protein [Motiliproteus sp. SC1-56]|uniref:DNA replication terminus site-binding protein n=1 Tax=Motiliproteus sp. SC1-56 TaxID=2799565 RepID=UPI001A8DAF06|nr:DNA replication terminus site-binding protein [Motiliproteus sp. SC1-56]
MATSLPHARVVEAFESLNRQLDHLKNWLDRSDLPFWVPLTEEEQARGLDPRTRLVELCCNLWYRHAGDGRRTDSRHGLVAADAAGLACAHAVNRAKQEFQQALGALRQLEKTDWSRQLGRRPSDLREALSSKGLARLHLRQCYRQIPCTDQHPERVGFNWYCSGRSIQRIRADKAHAALLKLDTHSAHIQVQLDKVARLPPHTGLARVQQQAPLMRANIVHSDGSRRACNLSLPLFFAWDPARPFPDFNQPTLSPPPTRQRRVRSDCRIEATPFLPSLRVHRYAEDMS